MRIPRFHVPEAAPGARVILPEHSAHHAREVLRLSAGDAASVFDGSGNEFEATFEVVSRERVVARLGPRSVSRPESPLRIVLALPPLKGDLMELVVQKATELGVSALWPVVTTRTDAAARPALRGSRQERWEKVASGAAEQCGRSVVPAIRPTIEFDAFLAEPFEGLRLVFSEDASAGGLPSLSRPRESVLALVGPAGGLDPREMERLIERGFTPVRLGPRTLRAETAAVAAAVAIQLLFGDLS